MVNARFRSKINFLSRFVFYWETSRIIIDICNFNIENIFSGYFYQLRLCVILLF